MSRRTAATPPEEILNTRVGEASSRDRARIQNTSRTRTDMMLASRPRTFDHDLVSEPHRAILQTDYSDNEESQYLFTSFPSSTITSNRIAPQALPTNTAVHLAPIVGRIPLETHGQGGVPQYELTQNCLKFKGNVKGIKIIATQVASKAGQYTSAHHQSGEEEYHDQSQGHGKKDNGFVNQRGAVFLQSVIDTELETSQSVEGIYIVKQEAVEVEGDVTGGSFTNSQRVW